jgi:hypothetical protein
MKVMVLLKADADTEAGIMPGPELLAAMGQFNEELVREGVMLAGEGLQPSSKGVRVRFAGVDRHVVPGPFRLEEGIVCGFWLWQVGSMDEAVAWAKRCPFPDDNEVQIELRPLFEAEDFGAAFTPELRAQEDRLRAEIAARTASQV